MRGGARSVVHLLAWLAAWTPAVASQGDASHRITGRVVDENGKPIAGAAVGVFGSRDFVDTARLLAMPTAVTAADGSYAIATSEAFLYGTLVLAAAGRQACALQIRDEAGGEMGETVLVPGGRLVGRVRDESGAPIAGARIRVESSIVHHASFLARLLAGAISNEKGAFEVPCVPRSGLRVTVEADGHLPESRLVAQGSSSFTLHDVGMVRGKVVDAAGAPLAGIHVNGVTVEARDAHQSVTTAADGTFAITVPKKGRFRVSGYEPRPPHRQWSSGLLHGPADDVVLTDWSRLEMRTLEVSVVDKATRAPIPKFQLSEVSTDPSNLQLVMFHHYGSRRTYEGKARLQVKKPVDPVRSGGARISTNDALLAIVVEAPGHGFEVVPVPGDVGDALEVALGREAILTGRVLDAETGKPMASVAVQALPRGTSFGSAARRAEDIGPLSDAAGNYRITGLRPGDYGVQVHAAGRPASEALAVTLLADSKNELDVSVPKQRWLELELRGTLPAGPACRLSFAGAARVMAARERVPFEYALAHPAPLHVAEAGAYRLGPVGNGTFRVELFVPSRTRTATGTIVKLGDVDPDRGPTRITLPDLTRGILRGRVVMGDVPSERVAVLASPAPSRGMSPLDLQQPNVAGVEDDGSFAIDLPTGSYSLQLVDLLTGIVFHTEAEDLRIDESPAPIDIRPEIRWLEVECVPKRASDEVVLLSLGVTLARPRDGACGAFLRWGGRTNNVENSGVPFRLGAVHQRWLVPEGAIEIKAMQTFEALLPWCRGWQGVEVDSAKLDIDKPEQRITLTVPPPPSDADLLRRQ